MNHIDVDFYSVTFFVETKHGTSLEFVLTDAKERTGRDYANELWDSMNQALKDVFGASEAEVVSQRFYGGVSYRLNVSNQENIEAALKVCSDAIERWIKRYHINSMKN